MQCCQHVLSFEIILILPNNLYVSTILGSLHAIFILKGNLEIICGVYIVYKIIKYTHYL